MTNLEFENKIRKVGTSYIITVPMSFIKYKLIDIDKKLKVKIMESENNV